MQRGDLVLGAGQRVGVQHRQVGQLAGFDRASDVFVECQVGAASRGDAQGFLPAQRLAGGHGAAAAAAARDRVPDGAEQRDRQVVAAEGDGHSGIPQAAQRHDVVLAAGAAALHPEIAVLIDMAIGMRGQNEAEIAYPGQGVGVDHRLVAEHPALVVDGMLAVGLLEQGQQVGPDARHADAGAGGLGQQRRQRAGIQGGSRLEAGPAGTGVIAGPQHVVQRILVDLGIQALYPQHLVAPAAAGQPGAPFAQQFQRLPLAARPPVGAQDQGGPHGRCVLVPDRPVGVDDFVGDAVSFEHGRGAVAVVFGHRVPQAAGALLGGEARGRAHQRMFDDGHQCPFDEPAGGAPRGIAFDVDIGRRRGRGRRHARQRQGAAVGDRDQRRAVAPISPDGPDVDGMAGTDPVQVVSRGVAAVGQRIFRLGILRWPADGLGHDPGSRRRLGGFGGDDVQDVVPRARAGQAGQMATQALAVHVGVAVGQPWQHRLAAQVHPPRLRTGHGEYVVIASHGGDVPATDRDGRGDVAAVVAGDDLASVEDQGGRHGRMAPAVCVPPNLAESTNCKN